MVGVAGAGRRQRRDRWMGRVAVHSFVLLCVLDTWILKFRLKRMLAL